MLCLLLCVAPLLCLSNVFPVFCLGEGVFVCCLVVVARVLFAYFVVGFPLLCVCCLCCLFCFCMLLLFVFVVVRLYL